MCEWKECKLGEVYDFASGLSKSRDQFGFGYSFLSFKDVFHNYFIPKEITQLANSTEKERERCSIKRGDVFLTRTSETQEELGMSSVALKDYPDATFNGFTKRLRPKNNMEILPEYAGFYFRSPRFRATVTSMASVTTRASLNNGMLSELTIVIPPLPEQRAIASVLSSLDNKIDLLRRQNKTLEAMAEMQFRQWFVEEADEGWGERVLGDVIELFDHLRIPLSKMERDKKKDGKLYPYYGAAKIMDHINEFIFDGDYILLGEDGTVRTNEGYPVLQYATGKFWVNNHTHVIKAKPPYNNFFLWNYLSKKNIDEIITGAVQPKINQGNLKALDFPKFPTDLVMEFNERTESFFKKMNQNKSQVSTIEKLRDTLLPKLMSGEVRVKLEQEEVCI